jgi:hypothetical protein
MRDVQLSPGIPGGHWARLRPMCGHDEAFVDPEGFVDTVPFLDRLLASAAGTSVGPGSAANLTVSDCDRLCASIYLEYFSDRIESRAKCKDCQESFDLTFSLSSLMESLNSQRSGAPDEFGVFTAADGRRFRLPTAGEQRQLTGLGAEEAVATLLEQCVIEGSASAPDPVIEKAMAEAGATLDVDLDAICPHCEAAQTLRFDMQSYLFRALGYERLFLLDEVHRIASAYGWAYNEIMELRRDDRRRFARLIESERGLRRRTL